jgi:hypothetical protein
MLLTPEAPDGVLGQDNACRGPLERGTIGEIDWRRLCRLASTCQDSAGGPRLGLTRESYKA